MCEKNTDNIFTWNDDALVGSAGVNVAHGGGVGVDTDCGLQWKLMIHFHTVTGLATEHWMVQSCAQQWPLARYLVTWCDGLIWWRHSGSLQCSANTNKDTFLSRSCVYLELYFIITKHVTLDIKSFLIHFKDTDCHLSVTDSYSPHSVQMWNFRSWINLLFRDTCQISTIPQILSHTIVSCFFYSSTSTILKRKPYVTAWQREDKWRKHFPRCGWWNVLSVRPGSAARTQEPVFLITTPGVTTSTLPRHRLHDTTIVWQHVSVTCFLTTPHTGAAEDGSGLLPAQCSQSRHHLLLSNCLLF